MDIEAEYKANASKKKAPDLNAEEALRYDMNLMYKLQMKKFKAHPELVKEITDRGGVAFLEASTHTKNDGTPITKGSRWEGKGINSNFIKVLIKSYEDSMGTTQPSTSVKGFQGYKGGFENIGKGTPQGDGKDKAMRQIADSGFIGELDTTTGKESSTLTSFNIMSRGATVALTDLNKASKQFPVIALKPTGTTVMLARNKELSNKPLAEKTKSQILSAKIMGKQFVVGDMPGVDSPFTDYLQEIGAKFTIYHTGATPRIQVSQLSTSVKEGVKNISTPVKSKKLEYTVYNSIIKRNITKSGYKLTIPEFPNVELYLTNENSTQDSQEGSIEFNTKSKEWSIEVVHPTKGIMTIGTPFDTTMAQVLETFTNDINKHSKTEYGIKVLKEIGIDFTQSSTSVENNFKTRIDQFTYTLNTTTGEVIHNSKTGDRLETNETQIGKVYKEYALANNYETKEFNKQNYAKVFDKVVNINNGSIVTMPNIVLLFNKETENLKNVVKSGAIVLNTGQKEALAKFTEFLDKGENKNFLLKGRAGTGKTTIASTMMQVAKEKGYRIFATAISDAATTNLSVLSKNTPGSNIEIYNFAAMYGLVPQYDDEGNMTGFDFPSENSQTQSAPKISNSSKTILIFDEASMVSQETLSKIQKLTPDITILYMGDNAQIMPIGDTKISTVFALEDQHELTEVMRQKENSPILDIASNIAREIDVYDNTEELKLSPILDNIYTNFNESKNSGSIVTNSKETFINEAVEDFKKYGNKQTLVITGNNDNVESLNKEIRKKIVISNEQFVSGERLMTYSKYSKYLGKNASKIEIFNSSVVNILSVSPSIIDGVPTNELSIEYVDQKGETKQIYMNVIHKNNKEDIKRFYENKKKLNAEYKRTRDRSILDKLNDYSQTVLVDYAYAMTAHKAQGQTVRNTYVLPVYRGFSNLEARRMFYTSITRPTDKLVTLDQKANESNTTNNFSEQPQQLYSQYLDTGKQDIEGFKNFVTQSSTSVEQQEIISTTPEQLKKDVKALLDKSLKELKEANAVGENFILGFHGGKTFDKPDRNKQYTGEFRNPDSKRIAESMGARYEGQMLFYTEDLSETDSPQTYEDAINGATGYAIRYGDDMPSIQAYLIPINYADFANRGIGEVGVSYDDIEADKIKKIGSVDFTRTTQSSTNRDNVEQKDIPNVTDVHPAIKELYNKYKDVILAKNPNFSINELSALLEELTIPQIEAYIQKCY